MSLRFLMFFVLCISSFKAFSMETNYLVVLRHGHGEHLVSGVLSSLMEEEGGIDHRLTDQGRAEVARTAQDLLSQGFNRDNVKLVLVSPLNRTKETAQILVDYGVCSAEVLQIEERIREYKSNDLEGLAKEDLPGIRGRAPWTKDRDYLEFLEQRGGENVQEFTNRVYSALNFLEALPASQGHIILVTHGAVVSVISSLYGDESLSATAEARVFPFPLK